MRQTMKPATTPVLATLAFLVSLAPALAEGPPAFTQDLGHDHPLAGRIWSTREGAFVAPRVVDEAVADARFVLLGETHDNPDHHRLQAYLLDQASRSRKPAVVFEMLPRDLAPKVADYLAGGGTAEGFGAAVGWADLGWPDYGIYRPVLEVAIGKGLAVVAADTPKPERRAVAGEGIAALGAERAGRLALDRPLGEAAEAEMLDTLFESHCALMPRESLRPLLLVQRLRDATLAEAMIAADERGDAGAVLIAGAGHTRRDLGVPWYLSARLAEASSVSLAFVEVREGEDDPAAYAGGSRETAAPYDFVWFTPGVVRGDPCEGLKERFGKKGK
jgi:uncharacterized iron-regulated protein